MYSQHLRMLTARMKYDKETEVEGKEKGAKMKSSKAGTKSRSPKVLAITCAYRPLMIASPRSSG